MPRLLEGHSSCENEKCERVVTTYTTPPSRPYQHPTKPVPLVRPSPADEHRALATLADRQALDLAPALGLDTHTCNHCRKGTP